QSRWVRLRNDAAGILKTVAGIPIRVMKNLCLGLLGRTSLDRAINLEVGVVARVDKTEDEFFLPLGSGNGDAEWRQIRRLHSHSRLGTVWLEKRKGMIGRSSNASLALGAVSKQKGLQYVYDLRNVTHNEL